MNTQVTPEAFFDSLSLAHKLDNFLNGFKLEEVHLFSYFSFFLYFYAGNSATTWAHRYIVEKGYPFSDKINEAIMRHVRNGLFGDRGEYYSVTGRGADEFNKFKDMPSFVEREKILNAACVTSILLPYSQTLRALLSEPDLQKAKDLNNNDWLGQTSLYPQFKEISEAVGIKTQDLVIPAVTWINFLNEKVKN